MTAPRAKVGGIVLVVCLVLVAVITTVTPDSATDVRRRWDDVSVGQWGQTDQVSARVTRVQLTRSAATSYERVVSSEVTLVVVDYEASVRRELVYFSEVTLHTADDRDYEPRNEFGGMAPTQPGFTRRGSLVFEVPDARVAGSELRFDRDGAAFDVYSTAIRVDLGLSGPATPEPGPVPVANAVTEVTP